MVTLRHPRRLTLALVVALSPAMLAGCFRFWGPEPEVIIVKILNDSDATVVVDVRWLDHKTLDVPAHSYEGLIDAEKPLKPEWAIRIVDRSCRPIAIFPLPQDQPRRLGWLIYVAPDGQATLVDGQMWSYGLRTAKETAPIASTVVCPSP